MVGMEQVVWERDKFRMTQCKEYCEGTKWWVVGKKQLVWSL